MAKADCGPPPESDDEEARMPPVLRTATLLVLAALPTLAGAAALNPFTGTYEVRRNGELVGEATLRLVPEGSLWRFSSETRGTQGMARTLGLRVDESSLFRLHEGRPETREYRYRQRTSFNSRERAASVDPGAGRIVFDNRGTRQEQAYVPGVLDRQLVTLALMQAVAAGRRGEQVFQVAGRNAVEAQTWRIGGVERVPLGTAAEEGIRVERLREPGDGKKTLLWLDRDQGHLPLRIEQTDEDGERVEMRLLRRG